MKVYKPTDSEQYDSFSIFLAGSIEMGAAEDWQTRLTNELESYPIAIFNPRRDEWDSSWVQSITNPNFNYQVNWELDMLTASDIIFMYFSPETKSPISLLELGLFADSDKMIVVCPDGFWRKGNVEIVCDRFDIPLYNTFEEGLNILKTKLNKLQK